MFYLIFFSGVVAGVLGYAVSYSLLGFWEEYQFRKKMQNGYFEYHDQNSQRYNYE